MCLHIGWFEVLEVLEGECCLDRCVSDYHPSRDVGFLVCLPVGFVVNTVVTSGGSTILQRCRFRLNCCSYYLSEYVGSCIGQVVFILVSKYSLPFGEVGHTDTCVPAYRLG